MTPSALPRSSRGRPATAASFPVAAVLLLAASSAMRAAIATRAAVVARFSAGSVRRATIGSVAAVLALLFATPAHADAPLLSSRSRVDATNVSLLLGLSGFGAGYTRALDPGRTAIAGELVFAPVDGVVDLRGTRTWQLTDPARLFAATVQVGVMTSTVLRGPVDFGAGPEAGIFAGLGRERWEVFTGAQAGVEAFLRTGGPRVPVRALLGFRGRLFDLTAGLTARGGVDVEPATHLTWRGDVVLVVGWYGLSG